MLAGIATRISDGRTPAPAIALFQAALMLLVVVDLAMVHEAAVGFRPHGAVWISIQAIGFLAAGMVPVEAWHRTRRAEESRGFVEAWGRAADTAFAIWFALFAILGVIVSGNGSVQVLFRSVF